MSFGARSPRGRKPAPDAPLPSLTLVMLERSALWHLGRRALTTAELRAALKKKAARCLDNPESGDWIEAIVARFTASQALDDGQVSRRRIATGRARGWSKRRIEQKLRGVDAEVKTEAFTSVDSESAESAAGAELAAAVVFVQKKLLNLKAKDPQKAMGALARQGFSYAIAKAALAAAE